MDAGKKQANGQQPGAASEVDSLQQEQYKRLKAGADALMDAGEMDAYDLTREDLERGAALFAPRVRASASCNHTLVVRLELYIN